MIAYAVQGPKDIVQAWHTGLLVDKISSESLAIAIREVINNPRLLNQMGRQARTYAEGCTWERIMGGIRSRYLDLAIAPQSEVSREALANSSTAG